ncbi:hypothetical protein [Vibrio furnissii]|uniref:hypothetical protein n=1 Tax=Vibrio furnissii TaxID=29494 RepID=UPI0037510CD1
MYNLIKDTLKLDIFNVNWDVSSKKINQVELTSSGKYRLLEGVGRFLYHVFSSIFYFKFAISPLKESVILFSGTPNQTNALNKLCSMGELLEFGNQGNYRGNRSYEAWPYLLSFIFIPVIIWKYISEKDSFRRRMILCRFDRYIFSYGLYMFFRITLNSKKTRLIIVSNDHSVWQRSILFAAKKNGIKVAYVQHANVSDVFPALDFDYAFLDGTHAKECYLSSESAKVYRVGCLRFEDLFLNLKGIHNSRDGILLCFNKIDSEDVINKIVDFFTKKMLEQ